MAENLMCDICNLEFNNVSIIPKVLPCGHTFCSPCMKKIIKDNPFCPKCRKQIRCSETSCPTNYSFLEVLESYKSMRDLEYHFICSINIMRNRYLQEKNVQTKIAEITSPLEQLTLDDKKEITGSKRRILTNLEDGSTKTDSFYLNFRKLRLAVSISVRDYETTEKYLIEIYRKIQNDEKIYSFHLLEGTKKYGKVTVNDNKIIFHSLSLHEIPEDSSLLWHDDLKLCLNSKNFYTFIKITCNKKGATLMIIIKLFDRHTCNQFIKLCTGECGPSYMGSFYKEGNPGNYYDYESVLYVNKIVENEGEKKKSIDYKFCGEKDRLKFDLTENEMLLYLFSDGTFQIFRCWRTKVFNGIPPAGVIVSPTNLCDFIDYDDSSYMKIVDCGIVFDV